MFIGFVHITDTEILFLHKIMLFLISVLLFGIIAISIERFGSVYV